MFSRVSWFSSLVSFIRLRSFSLVFYFLLAIPRSTELTSEEKNNCNNMTFRVESFRSGSHMTIIIQNFTLVSLNSTMTPHPVELLLGVTVSSLSTHLTAYILVSLHTWFLTVTSVYQPKHSAKVFISDCLLVETCSLLFSIIVVRGKKVELLIGCNPCSSFV